jgi:hypothetical protein
MTKMFKKYIYILIEVQIQDRRVVLFEYVVIFNVIIW